MTEKLTATLRESALMRWTALLLLSATMVFAYMFVDVLAPIEEALKNELGWTPSVFGTVGGAGYLFNVLGFMVLAGIILDRIGVRNSTMVSGGLMVVGAAIKFYAVSGYFSPGVWLYDVFNAFMVSFPPTAKLVCVGFALFGCGVEMAGITVSKGIVKWFQGKELAMAMGAQVAISRVGVSFAMLIPKSLYPIGGIPMSVGIPALLMIIGLLFFFCYFMMDKKLDQQENIELAPEDEFKISDLGKIFSSKALMITTGICLFFYAGIFPFNKFAVRMLENRLMGDTLLLEPNQFFAIYPILAAVLTIFMGRYMDKRGNGIKMLILGSILVTISHLIFALVPDSAFNFWVAILAVLVLCVSFSLVPAALWPLVPQMVESKVIGSAYAVIFWIQNIGLLGVPILIGNVLEWTNVNTAEGAPANYTTAMLVFAGFGAVAIVLGFWLKHEDKKKGYGLELPNKG